MNSGQDPNDQSGNPYQPYGAPYGQQPPPDYGYGPGQGYGYGYAPRPSSDGPRANAIVALVLNLIATVSCCNILAIPGAILAGMALGRVDSDPGGARRMLVWSWVLFGLGFALAIAVIIFLGVMGYLDD